MTREVYIETSGHETDDKNERLVKSERIFFMQFYLKNVTFVSILDMND